MKRHIICAAAALAITLNGCASGNNGPFTPTPSQGDRSASATALLGAGSSCKLSPSTLGTGDYFDVAGASTTDAWAVGGNPPNSGVPIIDHFNGVHWSHSMLPPLPGSSTWTQALLSSIAPISRNDVWVTGSGFDGTLWHPITLHWDGLAWKLIPNAPQIHDGFDMNVINGDASNDVWAAAVDRTPPAILHNLVIERWNGASWSAVPSLNTPYAEADGMLVFGPNDVWIVLARFNGDPQVVHWDGSVRHTYVMPNLPGFGPVFIADIAGTSSNDVWVTGDTGPANTPYIAHKYGQFVPFNVQAVPSSTFLVNAVAAFTPKYALATAVNGVLNTSSLLVYNGIDRWRPTADPWASGTAPARANVVKGTTSFWSTIATSGQSEAGLIVCPPSPPAPLH